MKYSFQQSSFNSGVWSSSLWHRFSHEKYPSSLRESENFYCLLQGNLIKRSGLVFDGLSGAGKRLYTFIRPKNKTYILEFGDEVVRVITDSGVAMDGASEFELTVPYAIEDIWELKFAQTEGRLFINHHDYDEGIIEFGGSSDIDWSFATPTYGASIAAPTGLATSGGTTYQIKVSAVNVDGEESVLSATSVQANTGSTITWTAVTGADRYYIYQYNSGLWQQAAISGTNSWTYPSSAISPDPDKGPYTAYNYFSGTGNKPHCSAFYQQRKFSANTINDPKRILFSTTGNLTSYNSSTPTQDDDAFAFNPADTGYNEIKWLVAAKKLVGLGNSGEYIIGTSSNTSSAITPTNLDVNPETNIGVGDVEPVVVENSILFFDHTNRELIQYGYSLADDGYTPVSLTVLAGEIFDGCQVVDAVFIPGITPRYYCVTDCGDLIVLVYSKAHGVFGWYRYVTDGKFKSCAKMQVSTSISRPYFIVERENEGGTIYTLEYIADEDFTDETTGTYADSCVIQDDVVASKTVNGLDHLEGRDVVVLADGVVYDGLTVDGGEIELPYEHNRKVVGLPYTAKIRTLSPVLPQSNSLYNKVGSIISAIIRIKNSRELYYGLRESNMYEYIFRGVDDGEATDLFSGDAAVSFGGSSGIDNDFYIRSSSPVPLNIQGITYYLEVNDAK